EANRISALAKLNRMEGTSAYDRVKELAEKHAHEVGISDPEHVNAVSISTASMICSYPGNKTLEEQVEAEWRIQKSSIAEQKAKEITDGLQHLNEIEKNSLKKKIEWAKYDANKLNEVI